MRETPLTNRYTPKKPVSAWLRMTRSSASALSLVTTLAVALVLSGCASTDEPMYVDAEEISDLKVPETLDQPSTRTDYEVPGYYLPELAAGRDMGRPPQVQSSVDAEASNAQIRFGARGLHLEVEASAEQVMQALGSMLNDQDAGLSVETTDDERQRFVFRYRHDPIVIPKSGLSRLWIWREPEVIDYSGGYQVKVVGIGEARARVELVGAEGQLLDLDRAEHILAIFRQDLG